MEGIKTEKVMEIKHKDRERNGNLGTIDLWKKKKEVTEGLERVKKGDEKKKLLCKRNRKTPRFCTAGGEKTSIIRVIKEWIEKWNRKWERIEESLKGIVRDDIVF